MPSTRHLPFCFGNPLKTPRVESSRRVVVPGRTVAPGPLGYARVSKADGSHLLDLQRDALSRKSRDLVRRVPLPRATLRFDQVHWRHLLGYVVAGCHGPLVLRTSF